MNKALKILRSFLIGGIGIFAVIFTIAFAVHYSSGAYEFTSKFEEIKLGSPISKAVLLLGEPQEITNEFRLGQLQGYEEAYKKAKQSGAVSYYIWSCCIDKTYTIGVNTNKNIVVAEYGGT